MVKHMLSCQKQQFKIPLDITYLNCAYMSPLSHQVEQAGINGVQRKNTPWEVPAKEFFDPSEKLKSTFAKIINAPDAQRIALIPSVSYGIANAANNIKANGKKEILLVDEQFPSNYYAWERLAKAENLKINIIRPTTNNTDKSATWNEQILDAINADTLLVSMPIVHWSDGTLFDIKSIRTKTKEEDALLIVDGTQSIGALPFDIQDIQLDALITCGYKWLMGGYSLGYAYYGAYFDNGSPIEESWMNRLNSDDFTNLVNYESEYRPAANRYMVGEHSNFVAVPMGQAALTQLLEWGVGNIQDYCKNLTIPLINSLQDKGYMVEENGAYHIVGVRFPEHISIAEVKQRLTENKIFVSQRGNAVRLAPNVYNNPADIEKILACF